MTGILPRKAAKPPIPTRKGVAFWIERGDGAVLLRRRPDNGLLGGMMEIPSTTWAARLPHDPKSAAPFPAAWRKLSGKVEHTFTHFHLELSVLKSEGDGTGELPMDGNYRWVPRRDLAAEALPTLMRKVVAHVGVTLPDRERTACLHRPVHRGRSARWR